MIINKNIFSKVEKKELRKIVGMAYKRELSNALEEIEKKIVEWRENKIGVFEVENFIHKFHNDIARDLWKFYTSGYHAMIVSHVINKGIILETEISPNILEKLK